MISTYLKLIFREHFFFLAKTEHIVRQTPTLYNYSWTQQGSGHMAKECMDLLHQWPDAVLGTWALLVSAVLVTRACPLG